MVLLDATADIDGVRHLCPERQLTTVPNARYDNLTIVCVPSITRERASSFLKSLKNRRAYEAHMKAVIEAHMEPGQRGLVVCKKTLFDNEHVPMTTKDEPWDLGGRLLAATHWGVGIGGNSWKDADVVFLFDEFHRPKPTSIAITQGLGDHKATDGPLARMSTQRSKSPEVDIIAEGHLLRYTKQMATRGNARNFDEHGACGKQKLVFMGDTKRLLASKEVLFPGAKVHVVDSGEGGTLTYEKKLYEMLSAEHKTEKITTNAVGQHLKVRWGDISGGLMKDRSVINSVEALGWRYVRKRGRGGALRAYDRRPVTRSLRGSDTKRR